MIKLVNTFTNKFQDGMEYKVHNFKVEIGATMTMHFKIKELPKKSGGTYLQFPQNVYNKQLAQETDYKKGVEHFITPNKELIDECYSLVKQGLDTQPVHTPISEYDAQKEYEEAEKRFTQDIEPSDINLEDIEF